MPPDDDLTIRFTGETPYQALINHQGLDIEEEQAFQDWLRDGGQNWNVLTLERLEWLFDLWKQNSAVR